MAPTWVEAVIAPVNVRVKNRLSTRNSGSAVTAEDSALSEKINQITLQQAAEKAWRLKQNWHQFVFSCLWAVLWAPDNRVDYIGLVGIVVGWNCCQSRIVVCRLVFCFMFESGMQICNVRSQALVISCAKTTTAG